MSFVKSKISQLIHRIKSTSFLKSVFTLSSGAIIAQAINFIGMPFLGRIYSPAAIGDYQLVVANSAVISSVAALGLMTALMIPKEDEESRGLCKLLSGSTAVISTVVVVFLWLLRDYYKIFNPEAISYGSALFTLWVYINSLMLNNVCYAYVNRMRLYKAMFWNPVIGASFNICIGITLGLMGWGFLGYTLAHILGYLVNIIHLMIRANPFAPSKGKEYGPVRLLRKYKRFPFFQMPANLISNLGHQLPVQTIETLYGASALGMYSMALRILSLPTTLLATPVNRVFYQEATQRYNRGENIGHFAYKILETNIKIAIIPISILMIFGRQIFRVFLGQQWTAAGDFASIMGIYQLLVFCDHCLSGNFVIIGKNSWNLFFSFITLLLNVALFVICKFVFNTTPIVYSLLLAISMTLKSIAVEACFFGYLKFPISRYIQLVLLYIVLPTIASLIIRVALFGWLT